MTLKSNKVHIPDDVFELLMQLTRVEPAGVNATLNTLVWNECLRDIRDKVTLHKERQ